MTGAAIGFLFLGYIAWLVYEAMVALTIDNDEKQKKEGDGNEQ